MITKTRKNNKIMNKKQEKEKVWEEEEEEAVLDEEHQHSKYIWWFYVDQPNRTNINFKNMIIIHGYCILYSNDCDLFESFFPFFLFQSFHFYYDFVVFSPLAFLLHGAVLFAFKLACDSTHHKKYIFAATIECHQPSSVMHLRFAF